MLRSLTLLFINLFIQAILVSLLRHTLARSLFVITFERLKNYFKILKTNFSVWLKKIKITFIKISIFYSWF